MKLLDDMLHFLHIRRYNDISIAYLKLRNIPYLNCGGCLIAAYAIYKHLNDENISIVQFDTQDNYNEFSQNVRFIGNVVETACSGTHFGLFYNKPLMKKIKYYDSQGCIDTSRYDHILMINSNKIDDFCKSALLNGAWNQKFNRNKYIPIIEEILDVDLNFLKN